MIVASFDLSTTSTGVVVAKLRENLLVSLLTFPLAPKKPKPSEVGFLNTKKVMFNKGVYYRSYVKHAEEKVSITTKRKRDRKFNNFSKQKKLNTLSKSLAEVVTKHKPDLILYEKNLIFGGILTTEQLSKLAGVLLGIAAANNIKTTGFNVGQVRAAYSVVDLVRNFTKGKDPEELKRIKDITKVAIRDMVCTKYNIGADITLDESDALLIFDYWRNSYYKNQLEQGCYF